MVKDFQSEPKAEFEACELFFSPQESAPISELLTDGPPNDSQSIVRVVDLPAQMKISRSFPSNILHQFDLRIKKLIHEQQAIKNTFAALFEATSSAVLLVDVHRRIQRANQNFIRLIGHESTNLIGDSNLYEYFHKKDRKKIERFLKQLESANPDTTSEAITVQCLCSDKSARFVEFRATKVAGQNYLLIMLNDVTKQKQYEQEILRRTKELTLLNTISRLINHPKDLRQILNVALDQTRSLLGIEMGAIYQGNQFLKTLQPIAAAGMTLENANELLEQYREQIKQIKRQKEDLFLNSPNGKFWEIFGKSLRCRSLAFIPLFIRKSSFGLLVLASKSRIEFDQEKRQLLSAIGHQLAINIENAILFKELEEKSREVEAKNKELSSFVFTVSHDLKTPLIALHGYISLFREEFQDLIDTTGQEYLDRIIYNAEYMNKMISDLLKLSRAGRVVGAKRRFSTYKLVKEIYMCFYPQILQHQINFSISKSLPIIYGDRQRLQTVFENLIGNAIKFISDKRAPLIEVDCVDRNSYYEFCVRDNGIGIDPADHQRIFEVFQKCERKLHDNNGTGVGLTIVKKIVEHHGGTVWVESKLDKGATFYFTLPKASSK